MHVDPLRIVATDDVAQPDAINPAALDFNAPFLHHIDEFLRAEFYD